MAIERMLTEEMPARVLVARVLAEAGIEYVFGISGGHTGRIISGLAQVQNQVRMVTVREESLAGVMAEVYGRLTRRPGVMIGQGPWVLGNGLLGTLEAFLSSLADAAADRFQRRAALYSCTRPISRRPAIRAAGTRAAPSAASPSRSCRRRSRSPRCRRRSSRSSTRWRASPGRSRCCSATTRWPAIGRRPTRSRCSIRPATICRPPPPPADAGADRGRGRAHPRRRAPGHHRRQRRAHRPGLRASCATSPRPPACRSRRPPPARAALPRRIRWRSACSARSAPPAANACIGEADLVLVVGSKLSPSDTAWENTQAARPDAAGFRADRHRAAQRLVELPGRDMSCSAMRRRSSAQLCEAVRLARGRPARGGDSGGSPRTARSTAISTRRPTAPTTSRSCRSGSSAN